MLKRKSKKRRAKRILGNDRFFMMLSRDIRKRWMQYGENRNIDISQCNNCGATQDIQKDHVKPLGPYPRKPEDVCVYVHNMIHRKCQALCKECHAKKTKLERNRRKKCKE